VLRFIEGPGAGLGRGEILKALARERGDRAVLKDILRDLAAAGLIGRRRRAAARKPGPPPLAHRRAPPCSTLPASRTTAISCCPIPSCRT
jgi:hypothetical protein